MVRAKFKCDSIVTAAYGKDNQSITVNMSPVYGNSEENKQFWRYTPAGSIALTIDNPDAVAQFSPGREYYIDFTPAKED